MRLRLILLVGGICAVWLAGWAVPAARAQVKPAVGDDKGKVIPAVPRDEAEFQRGTNWTLTLKKAEAGKSAVVSGRVVYDDGKDVYLRPAPGRAPVRVSHAMIDFDRSAPIRAVTPKSPWVKSSPEWAKRSYEIHKVEIDEGSRRVVRYITAPYLSQSEKNRLAELEAAENEVSRIEAANSFSTQLIVQQRDVEQARARAQELYYNYAGLTALGFFPDAFVNTPTYNYLYDEISPLYWGRGPAGLPGFGRRPFAYASWAVTLPAAPPVWGAVPETTLATSLTQAAVKEVSPTALAAAEKRLTAARANAMYDGDTIVAVKAD
jgi:hypothetical protein